MVVALNDFLELSLSIQELSDIARQGSETAYRSLLGGLSEYKIEGGKPVVSQLAPPESFKDVVIYAVSFNYPRFEADQLHNAVVNHPMYNERRKFVLSRVEQLKDKLSNGNIPGILEIMEDDARMVHQMFEDQGFTVRKKKMLDLCRKVEKLHTSGLKCFWNVAGASAVYVFCLRKNSNEINKKLSKYNPVEYKVAGPAKPIA